MPTVQEIEEMGRKLASSLQWNGINIMMAFSEALTDANYHHEAEVIDKMIAALEATDGEAHFELTIKK